MNVGRSLEITFELGRGLIAISEGCRLSLTLSSEYLILVVFFGFVF